MSEFTHEDHDGDTLTVNAIHADLAAIATNGDRGVFIRRDDAVSVAAAILCSAGVSFTLTEHLPGATITTTYRPEEVQ